MGKSRRIATAQPPAGGADRCANEGLEIGPRARELVKALNHGFKEHDLLTYSSAISFQILTAVIPFVLFVLAVGGLLHLDSIWQDHLQPEIRANVPPALFTVITNAVNNVAERRVLWATFGGALALWQVSGAVRAVMGALSQIYGAEGERPFIRRYSVSFVLSIEVAGCFILATVCALRAPFFSVVRPDVPWQIFEFLARSMLAVALLLSAVGLLVRHAPSTPQALSWVSLGATIVVVSWIIASLGFYFYLTKVASYASVFGSLASVIATLAYLYISTTVFLFGAQLDAIFRAQATGALSGTERIANPSTVAGVELRKG